MAAIAVAHEIGVVLEDRELPRDALLADLLLGVVLQILEDPLPCLVVDDELAGRGALGGRVFGMAARVLVEARAVFEEDVEKVLGRDQLLEQEADGLLDRQRLATFRREDDAVFALKTEDPLLHRASAVAVDSPALRAKDTSQLIG